MADLDEFSYQRLLHGKEVDFSALLRLKLEYQTALNSINSFCDAIDSKTGVILASAVAIMLGALGFIFTQETQTFWHLPLGVYALSLAVVSFFCMRVIRIRKHTASGVLPKIREANFSISRQVVERGGNMPSDLEYQKVILDKLDSSRNEMTSVVIEKSRNIKRAQNVFAYSSLAVFAVYFSALVVGMF